MYFADSTIYEIPNTSDSLLQYTVSLVLDPFIDHGTQHGNLHQWVVTTSTVTYFIP